MSDENDYVSKERVFGDSDDGDGEQEPWEQAMADEFAELIEAHKQNKANVERLRNALEGDDGDTGAGTGAVWNPYR